GGAAPRLAQRAVVHGVEAELVVEAGHQRHGVGVVARDDEGGAVRGAGRAGEAHERGDLVARHPHGYPAVELDVAERLREPGARELLLAQLVHRRRPGVDGREAAVARGHVVVVVEHDLAGELGGGQHVPRRVGEGEEGEVRLGGGVRGPRDARPRPERTDEARERPGRAGVGDDDVVARTDRGPGEGAAGLARAEDPQGPHHGSTPASSHSVPLGTSAVRAATTARAVSSGDRPMPSLAVRSVAVVPGSRAVKRMSRWALAYWTVSMVAAALDAE